MLVAPRFIVVDDKSEHLIGITKTFEALGSTCLGLQFLPNEEYYGLNPLYFSGLRCLFIDLHLMGDYASSDQNQRYAIITGILEDSISIDNGPFILVLWSENSQHKNDLKNYLDRRLDRNKPYAKPIAIFNIDKYDYINTTTGEIKEPHAMNEKIKSFFGISPQISALFNLEIDFLNAINQILVEITRIIPKSELEIDKFSNEIDRILSLLARESVGQLNVASNPRHAITTVIAPMLADRVLNQTVDAQSLQYWNEAITQHKDRSLSIRSPEQAGHMNKMLHLSTAPEQMKSSDWGAIVEIPQSFLVNTKEMKDRFSFPKVQTIYGEFFKLSRDERSHASLVLLRIGAACDYAQQSTGPTSYLLGVKINASILKNRNDRLKKENRSPLLSEWISPIFSTDLDNEPFRILINFRLPFSCSKEIVDSWNTVYRIREQLLTEIISKNSSYNSRPGIIQIFEPNPTNQITPKQQQDEFKIKFREAFLLNRQSKSRHSLKKCKLI